jgi:hypothetical protein
MRLPPLNIVHERALALGQSLAARSHGWHLNTTFLFEPRFLRPSVPAHAYMPKCATGTVPSGESDESMGSNRQNVSVVLADQQIQAGWITGYTPRKAENHTTTVSGMSPGLGFIDAMLAYRRAQGANSRISWANYAIGGARADMFEDPPGTALTNLNVPYDEVVVGETKAKALADAQAWPTKLKWMLWRQGEADINIAGYQATVEGLITLYNTELKSIWGQEEDPIWIGAQFSTFENVDGRTPITDYKALHIARQIILTGPDYWENVEGGYWLDYQHMNAEGYTRWGDLAAYTATRLRDDPNYDPCLYVTNVTRASGSADFYVTFHLSDDATTLVIDDVGVTDPGSRGIQLFANGVALTINTVTVHTANTLKVTVSAVPSDLTNTYRYANIGYTTAFGTTNPDGYVGTEMPRGCIRDDSERVTSDGTTVYAWALHEPTIPVTVT